MSNHHASTVNSFFFLYNIYFYFHLPQLCSHYSQDPSVCSPVAILPHIVNFWKKFFLCLSWPVRGWLMGHVQRRRKEKCWRLGVHRTKY